MPTEFSDPPPTTTWPGHPIEEAGKALAPLFKVPLSQEWTDTRQLFAGYLSYEQTKTLIREQLEDEVSEEFTEFLHIFNKLADGFAGMWAQWKRVLGSVVEEAFRILLAEKYSTLSKNYFQSEKCPTLYSEASKKKKIIFSMVDKSMDAVCWDETKDCGEMHEVKATILTFDGSSKTISMRKFRKAVMENTQGRAWIGFVGLYDPIEDAVKRIRAIIGLSESEEPLELDILGIENFTAWSKDLYLEVS